MHSAKSTAIRYFFNKAKYFSPFFFYLMFLCYLCTHIYIIKQPYKTFLNMDLLHIIAVAALVIIGIAIYINKRNG